MSDLRKKLEAAAVALGSVLSKDHEAWVTLWMPPDELAELEGVEVRSTCYVRSDGRPPYSIDIAKITIGQVEFKAQSKSRTSTPEEIADVERDHDLHELEEYRTTVHS